MATANMEESFGSGEHHSKRQKTFHKNILPALQYEHYTIAWISALHIEMAAARAMLDEIHESPLRKADDTNTYVLGKIHEHNIVIACLPVHEYGTVNAAAVVTNMRRTFPGIQIGLMVGIGGGAPGKEDIRLGDIVVGTRVMQYDLGKIMSDGKFHRSAFPRTHGPLLGTAVSSLRSKHELEPSQVPFILQEKLAQQNPEYACPTTPDRLFDAAYEHEPSITTCDLCDQSRLIKRKRRVPDAVNIHYGAIASGNQVMKHASTRDNIARELDVLCFEMEAAGIMDILPCLPIRGVCDYSDSHKNKEWQRYAAATAAAYARELIKQLPGTGFQIETTFNSDADQASTVSHRDRLLDSLKFNQIDSRRLNIKRNHAKTCQWILNHPDYTSWLDPACLKRTCGFLWISGKPGSGKSTIMKFMLLKMKSKMKPSASGEEAVTASFFFNARGDYLEKSIFGMYRSLLYQLLKGYPELQVTLDDIEIQCQDDCPSLNVLKDLFHSAVSSLGQRQFTCLIDALDECDEQQVREMVYFFEDLAEECTTQGISFRVCFSSRHYPYITIPWGVKLTLEDQKGHTKDLEAYIASRLLVKNKVLVEEIRLQLLTKAAGVFMWVVLVVDILNKEYERGGLALRKRLAEIPSDLSELFKDILQRDRVNMEVLLLCIRWLLFSRRPLQPQEFYHALWCDLASKDLADDEIPDVTSSEASKEISIFVISSSKGLAEITGSTAPTVQFIHESVRDFLIKDRGLFELWPELEAEWDGLGHGTLSKCCHRYMTRFSNHIPVQSLGSVGSNGYPFLEYATQNVLYHADSAAQTISQGGFLSSFPVKLWRELSNFFEKFKIRHYSSSVTLLYILADKGLSNLVREKMRDDPQINIKGERYRYPFFAALASGSKDTVAALLNLPSTIEDGIDIAEGLDLRKDLKTYSNRTPFTWAAQEGRPGILRHLVKFSIGVDELDGKGRTALSRASQKGHETVAKFLIQSGANVNHACEIGVPFRVGFTPIMLASENGHEAVVRLLVANGADINASIKDGPGPLILAITNGHVATVNVLIQSGAGLNTSDEDGWTPLITASQHGREAVARLLIENGADVNAHRMNATALENACRHGHEAVARLLIENGADVNGHRINETVLENACRHGHEKIARLLIENGADVNGHRMNETVLENACRHGHEEIVRLLIANGADVNAHSEYATALTNASLNGHEEIARLLIANGADVNAQSEYATALVLASRYGHEAVVRLLITNGADINASDEDGWKPLTFASANGHEGVARLLIANGADVNATTKAGMTPLISASRYGYEAVVRLLVEKGADINDAQDTYTWAESASFGFS